MVSIEWTPAETPDEGCRLAVTGSRVECADRQFRALMFTAGLVKGVQLSDWGGRRKHKREAFGFKFFSGMLVSVTICTKYFIIWLFFLKKN